MGFVLVLVVLEPQRPEEKEQGQLQAPPVTELQLLELLEPVWPCRADPVELAPPVAASVETVIQTFRWPD